MRKLYSAESARPVISGAVGDEIEPVVFDECEEDLDMAMESTQTALERVQCLSAMQGTLSSHKLCGEAYMASVSGYSEIVRTIGARLGVRHMPSLEDFANPYAAKASHAFAMEGFKDMIVKAWEKIKDFFRSFFKKIALFLKRIAKANLDLESYERYCDQLVAKLVSHKATLTDNAPMSSELPGLLAGKGADRIDSDFVLNQGRTKINSLISKVQDLTVQGGSGRFLSEGLHSYHNDLTVFIAAQREGQRDQAHLDKCIQALKHTGFGLLSKIFSYQLNDPKDIPGEAYQALLSNYDGQDLRDEGFTVLSVADPYDPYKELPRGVNMFLSHVNQSKLFIATSKEKVQSVEGKLNPIGSVNNLSQFHKDYKNTLGRMDLKGLDKSAESVGVEVEKVLILLQKEFTGLLAENTVVRKAYTPEFAFDIILRVKLQNASLCQSSALGIYAEVNHRVASIYPGFTDALDNVVEWCDASNPQLSAQVLTALKNMAPGTQQELKLFIDLFYAEHSDILGTDGPERLIALRDLNGFLTNLFTRVQSLYKGLMTDFYAVLTELRYAVIKYIYDSAKRYSY